MISYQRHNADSLAKRVFFDEPASPPPRYAEGWVCSPLPARVEMGRADAGAKNRKKQDMSDEEEDSYYYRAAFRSALLWSVIIVALMALIAWLV